MNKNIGLISIIIPCYNAEFFLDQCLNTLINQSYKIWEAICINDGSTDNTLCILEKYAKSDIRIKVYTQSNQGAAIAREYGITKAEGEFITFLDVDDTFKPSALQTMVETFTPSVDIVVSGFCVVNENKYIIKKLKSRLYNNLNYLKKILSGKYGWELWAKMYRRHLFDSSIKTPSNIRIGEDAAVFIQLVCKANQIRIIPDTVYNYIQYNQSASHIKSLKYAEETLQAAFFIEELLKRTSFYEQIKKYVDTMALLFYSNSTRKGYLSKHHPLISRMKEEHFKISALSKIPIKKAVYITLCYYCNLNKYT